MIILLKRSLLLLIILCTLTSCSGKSIHNKIVKQIESSYIEEEAFINSQQQLLDLEETDLKIYNEIIQLDEGDKEQLQQLTQEALELIDERKEYLDKERAAIDNSKEEFVKIDPFINQVSDKDVKVTVEKMYETMLKRFEVYDEVYEAYRASLHETELLYDYLSADTSYNTLHEALQNVNESYEQLFVINDQFNRLTKKYNQLKKEYEQSIRE